MSKKINVIKIIDDDTLVINIGSDDGVTMSNEFLVYSLDEELFDPDTNESLGRLELVKGKGIPQHIQEKITTIKSNTFKKIEKRKIIKKDNSTVFASLYGTSTEEIIEPSESERIPFEGPIIGDLAKIIKK